MSGEWISVMKKLLVAFMVLNVIQMAGAFGWFSSWTPATIIPAADASAGSDAGAVLDLATFSGSAHVPLFAVAKDSADHGGGNDKGGGNSGGGSSGGPSGGGGSGGGSVGGSSHGGGSSGGNSGGGSTSGGGSSVGSAGSSSGGSSHGGGSSGSSTSGSGSIGGSTGAGKSSEDSTSRGSSTSNDKSVSGTNAGTSDKSVSDTRAGTSDKGKSGSKTGSSDTSVIGTKAGNNDKSASIAKAGSSDKGESGTKAATSDKGESGTKTGSSDTTVSGSKSQDNSGKQVSGEKQSAAPKGVSLGVQGTTVHAVDSRKDLTINLKTAKDAGEKISVGGSSIRFDKGQTSISVATKGAPQEQDGKITGQVESIAMKSAPVGGQFADAGIVSASFHADLHTMPSQDATVSSVLVKTPAPEVQLAIEGELQGKGYSLESVAYTMEVQKSNLEDKTDVGQAVVTMSVSPNWVLNHGGITNTKIARFSDEGTPSILETQFVGLDSTQNMVFSGTSPGGLSIFAMIAVKPAGQTAPPQASPVPVSSFEGAGSLVVVPPLLFFAAMIWIRKQ